MSLKEIFGENSARDFIVTTKYKDCYVYPEYRSRHKGIAVE